MNGSARVITAILLLGGAWITATQFLRPTPRATSPMRHEAYVWQRSWNAAVTNAIHTHASHFASIVPLAAEIAWKEGNPQTTFVAINFELLKSSGKRIGLALRIGPYPGPFQSTGQPLDQIADVAASLLATASDHGLPVSELHLDFDCADSQLDGYRLWVTTLRTRLSQTPVILTALPSWLNERAFGKLAAAADGFILQVHSLERPGHQTGEAELCDPVRTRAWVEQASRWNQPFRVALPTYSYLAAFGPDREFLGASAEGPMRIWPANATLREIRTDPIAMKNLVHDWDISRPARLEGIIWYRLPVETDVLNWSWPTLEAVMQARTPTSHWELVHRWKNPGLAEFILTNDGEVDIPIQPSARVRWQNARLVAGDGWNGYDLAETGANEAELKRNKSVPGRPLRPGESRSIGWIRFSPAESTALMVEPL